VGVLLLFLYQPNRVKDAWLAWLPLLAVLGILTALQNGPGNLLSEGFWAFKSITGATAFAATALLLLSPLYSGKQRSSVFLGMLATMVVVGVLTLALGYDWTAPPMETVSVFMLLSLGASLTAVALSLAARTCRRRFGAVRFTAWTLGWLLAAWSLAASPIWLIALFADRGHGLSVLAMAALAAVLTFAAFLPFQVLWLASPFYRQRLLGMLPMETAGRAPTAPPISPPVEPRAS
jgi:uncharacterized protein (DUF486 family)